jgi:hypothetical protein
MQKREHKAKEERVERGKGSANGREKDKTNWACERALHTVP